MWRTMFYPKNVPNVERAVRIAIGIALLGIALNGQGLLGGLLMATAGFVVVTGFVGWCPLCALVGRKIKHNQSNQV